MTLPFAWCYLMKECPTLVKDTSVCQQPFIPCFKLRCVSSHGRLVRRLRQGPKYQPKYGVWPAPGTHPSTPGRNGSSAYARERRFFLSSTPTAIQPLCDDWCQMQDLCDKQHSGIMTSDMCFTECLENNGRAL
jgi:hypothetical protein